MTLLQSVNRVLRDLREDSIDSLSDEEKVQSIVDALNLSASDVLRSHEWTFLVRDDGQMFLPGRFQATTGASVTNGNNTILLNVGGANSWSTTETGLYSGDVRSRVRFTGDDEYGDTSWILDDLRTLTHFSALLKHPFRGTSVVITAPYEVYANEYVLPQTVRSVLSMRIEERPVHLHAPGDRHADFDRRIPRHTVSFQEHPSVAYVGGHVEGTRLSSGTATTGMGVFFWPIPSEPVVVHYSYVHQHPELSEDTDAWDGVPYEVVRLIERMALASELLDNRQADTSRAVAMRRDNDKALMRLQDADLDRQGRDRKVLMPFDHVSSGGDAWSRWSNRTPSV